MTNYGAAETVAWLLADAMPGVPIYIEQPSIEVDA
jgi:hypothetical protein